MSCTAMSHAAISSAARASSASDPDPERPLFGLAVDIANCENCKMQTQLQLKNEENKKMVSLNKTLFFPKT
jgi:hypothetical protein